MMKIQIQALPKDINKAVEKVKEVFQVLSVSEVFPNRNNDMVRVYIHVKLKEER